MAHETADEIVFTRFGKRDGILSGGVFLAAAHCAVRVLRLGDDLHVMRPWVESEGQTIPRNKLLLRRPRIIVTHICAGWEVPIESATYIVILSRNCL